MAYKKLSEAILVESVSDTANILIEENDEIKRVPKSELGGCSCPEILEIVEDKDGVAKQQVKEEYLPSGGYMFEYYPDTNRHDGDFNKVTEAVFNGNSVYIIRNDGIFLADCFGLSDGKIVNVQSTGIGTRQFFENGGTYDD